MLAIFTAFALAGALLAQARLPEQLLTPPPPYMGPADAGTAAGLANAGGGAQNFQIDTALSGIMGAPGETAEWTKMHNRYRGAQETEWAQIWKFVVRDAAQRAAQQHIRIASASQLNGYGLGRKLIRDGLTPDGTFETSLMLDHIFSHRVSVAVQHDVDARFTPALDSEFQKISNQVMYDVSFKIGMKNIKLSSLH